MCANGRRVKHNLTFVSQLCRDFNTLYFLFMLARQNPLKIKKYAKWILRNTLNIPSISQNFTRVPHLFLRVFTVSDTRRKVASKSAPTMSFVIYKLLVIFLSQSKANIADIVELKYKLIVKLQIYILVNFTIKAKYQDESYCSCENNGFLNDSTGECL